MKGGCKIEWTANALAELRATYKYLEDNWTEKRKIIKLKYFHSFQIDKTLINGRYNTSTTMPQSPLQAPKELPTRYKRALSPADLIFTSFISYFLSTN